MSADIQALAQECYDRAKTEDVPTRSIAEQLVRGVSVGDARAMAVEFLVGIVAQAQRADALDIERRAERGPVHELSTTSPSGRKGKARREWDATEEGMAWAAESAAADARSWQMLHGVIAHALDRYVEDLKMEWTAELLDSTFALRDGTTVAWGEATTAQHEERKAMFLGNAHANMEGAARHEYALRALAESGAETLRQCVQVAA